MPHQDPDLVEELALAAQGYRLIAGLDEVGRGAWAGDVVAAAVILPPDAGVLERLRGLRDSKQLSPQQRLALAPAIREVAVAIGIGSVCAAQIDRVGILQATRRAMMAAVAQLGLRPDFLLIDAVRLPELDIPQKSIVKGDARCLSIAAASVIAKVSRDLAMQELDQTYPGYGFARHKGYGTALHRACLSHLHPCAIHRRSYAPVRAMMDGTSAA